MAQFARVLAGELDPSEFRVLDKNGVVHYTRASSRPLTEAGKVVGITGLIIDITERHKMQAELEKYSTQLEQLVAERTRELAASKDYAENLIRTANAMVVGLDNNGNVQVFNQAAERITGYSREELQGRNWFEVIVPKDRYPQVWAEFERLTAGGLPKNFENPILSKSGEERYIIWQNNEVRDQGRIAGTISFGIDITERKRVEEELRSTEERLEYVVTSNPAVIYSGKPRADLSDWDLTYLSENVTNLLGYEAGEYVGSPEFWTHIVHPTDRPSVMAQVPGLWEKGRFTFEYRMRHKDGEYRWIREEANVIRDAKGKPVDVTGYWIDITEVKRLEAKLAESQRLAAIGETTTWVGHDLRNPLQAMTGTLYLAKRLVASNKVGDRKEAMRLLGTIDGEIEYMDKIVSDLQDYARPVEADQVETSLPDLIRAIMANMKIPRNVGVTVNIEDKLSSVRLDPVLFRRVLTNLTLNAVQAMPEGGKLTISGSRGDKSFTVAVQDTGIGIAPENLGKVFTPFFTTKAKGQGLGLAVCKRLIEVQGGTVSVTSHVGEGSTFTVRLPMSN
jgi:PAS domain S-box-containing protein